MYEGYRLKIGNDIFPNRFISKGTYHCTENKRVVGKWVDADLVETEITTGVPKAVISFKIIEHDSGQEHNEILNFFKSEEVTVTYYSDKTDSYRTSVFNISEIDFSHSNAFKSYISYNATPVTLTEK